MIPSSDLAVLLRQSPAYTREDYRQNHQAQYVADPVTADRYVRAGQDYELGLDYLDAGRAHLDHGRHREAEEAFDSSIRHSRIATDYFPGFVEAYQNMASAYFFKGEFSRVMEVCEIAQRIEPDVPDIHFQMARALASVGLQCSDVGDHDGALQVAQRSIGEGCMELAITGAKPDTIAALITAYKLAVKSMLLKVQRQRLQRDSADGVSLLDMLECEILCGERLMELAPNLATAQWLQELRALKEELVDRD